MLTTPNKHREARSWCFWSTSESIRNDVPSVMAIIETLIAIPLYWWIVITFETYLPFVVSIIVAPVVLLRSDNSVKLGLHLSKRFLKVDPAVDTSIYLPYSKLSIWILFLLTIFLMTAAICILIASPLTPSFYWIICYLVVTTIAISVLMATSQVYA
jgi:hypothetical protein